VLLLFSSRELEEAIETAFPSLLVGIPETLLFIDSVFAIAAQDHPEACCSMEVVPLVKDRSFWISSSIATASPSARIAVSSFCLSYLSKHLRSMTLIVLSLKQSGPVTNT